MLNTSRVKRDVQDGQPLYPFPEPPAGGTMCEVAPGVCWVRMPLPFALEHINLWLLADQGSWTIVDCGFGVPATRALWEAIFAQHLGSLPVSRIAVTHFHPDHFGAAAWLADLWQAPVLMTAPEFAAAQAWHRAQDPFTREAHLSMFERHGLRLAAAGGLPRENLFRRGVPDIPARITPLVDGQILTVGGRDWRVVTGHGHSPEHAALFCSELGVLIAGDMVLPRISTNVSVQPHLPDADPLGQFLASLARYADLDAETLVLPSHGLPFYGLRDRVGALARHHAARLEELHSECRVPRTSAEVMPVIFKRKLDAQQTFFAMGETLSHLNWLRARGQLARERGADGIYRFTQA